MARIGGVRCNLGDILTEVDEGRSHLVHLGNRAPAIGGGVLPPRPPWCFPPCEGPGDVRQSAR